MVAVKAYPSISKGYDELVCCAGVTDDHKWVRLYPVPYRNLPGQQQFQKGDVIEVLAERPKAHKDDRPESWKPKLDTMKIVDHVSVKGGDWRQRLEWIGPTILPGFAELTEKQEKENKSLGAFRPAKILGVKVTREASCWTDAQIATINQKDLFSDKEPLEKIPFRFQLGFETRMAGNTGSRLLIGNSFSYGGRNATVLKMRTRQPIKCGAKSNSSLQTIRMSSHSPET